MQIWNDRLYKSAFWSSGILISLVTLFVQNFNEFHGVRYFLSLAILAFGIITQIYLRMAGKAIDENGLVLVQIEAALSLCKNNFYIKGEPFFGYSGKWLGNSIGIVLRILHFIIYFISISILIFYKNPTIF